MIVRTGIGLVRAERDADIVWVAMTPPWTRCRPALKGAPGARPAHSTARASWSQPDVSDGHGLVGRVLRPGELRAGPDQRGGAGRQAIAGADEREPDGLALSRSMLSSMPVAAPSGAGDGELPGGLGARDRTDETGNAPAASDVRFGRRDRAGSVRRRWREAKPDHSARFHGGATSSTWIEGGAIPAIAGACASQRCRSEKVSLPRCHRPEARSRRRAASRRR